MYSIDDGTQTVSAFNKRRFYHIKYYKCNICNIWKETDVPASAYLVKYSTK